MNADRSATPARNLSGPEKRLFDIAFQVLRSLAISLIDAIVRRLCFAIHVMVRYKRQGNVTPHGDKPAMMTWAH